MSAMVTDEINALVARHHRENADADLADWEARLDAEEDEARELRRRQRIKEAVTAEARDETPAPELPPADHWESLEADERRLQEIKELMFAGRVGADGREIPPEVLETISFDEDGKAFDLGFGVEGDGVRPNTHRPRPVHYKHGPVRDVGECAHPGCTERVCGNRRARKGSGRYCTKHSSRAARRHRARARVSA